MDLRGGGAEGRTVAGLRGYCIGSRYHYLKILYQLIDPLADLVGRQ
jgi:hypothetical protein